ncbi:MAG: ATP-binding protein [Pseudomonadota bacterium]
MADAKYAALEERADRQRRRRRAAIQMAVVNGLLFLLGAAAAFLALRSSSGQMVALIAAIVVVALGILSAIFIVLSARSQARALPVDVLDAVVDGPVGMFHVDDRGAVTFMNSSLCDWLEADDREEFARGLFQQALDGADSEPRLEVRTTTGRLLRLTANIMDIDGGGRMGLVWRRHPFPAAGLTAPPETLARHFIDLLDETPLGAAVVDSTGKLVTANPALVAMLGDQHIEGRYLADYVAVEDRWGLIRLLADAAQSGSQRGAIEVRLANDSERSTTMILTPLRQPGSAVRGILLHAVDTTAKRHLEQQFEQSQRLQAVGQLAGGIAHDFNNILTAIKGFCDLLLRRHQAGDPSFGEITHIRRETDRAAGLVRQLLTFSRRQTPRPQVLSLDRTIDDLSQLLRRLIGEDVTLHVESDADQSSVRADQGQLEQIITNLVVNARDAMPQGGRILLRTSEVELREPHATAHGMAPVGPYVCLEVVDEGCGIAEADLAKIFEPFFTTKDVGKGTGLGLATVYGVLQQNDGFIEVESEVGAGTVFRVYLPRVRAIGVPLEPIAVDNVAEPAVSVPRDKGTVLLVEDEDTVRQFAVRALSASGYNVMSAESPAVALGLLDGYQGPLDLIVSDVVMPGMSGPEFVAAVTKQRGPLKVIYISGYAEDAVGSDAIDDAAFLAKPFDLAQLSAKVGEVLNQHGTAA